MQNQKLIIVGVLVHLVFFYSIFDIYFTSPLVHGMTPFKSPLSAPAKRLVLFVADGLRADKFFELDENGMSRAPYLRGIMEHSGAWGVSHTRVPTESRPGHVALIAGFYEDVSAVAKGWKENPVEFDSVFNESQHTWSWGSPDILPMFTKGATGNHVEMWTYPAALEDFADSDSARLDTWVFNKIKEFFDGAKTNVTLQRQLQQNNIVFFLHLLGIDTNGHSHKPHSNEYLDNIRSVDEGIKQVVELLNEYYGNDDKTAFVMTADHGMTNWGSHGAGHATETLTPLVVWGAGVRSPIKMRDSVSTCDEYSKDWQLQHLKRSDVEQADVAPLMASLIGTPYPLNSVGRLPVDYLSCSDLEKAEHLFANSKQILAQFQVKMDEKKKTTLSSVFRPFSALSATIQMEKIRSIRNLIKSGNSELAIAECQEFITTILEGLDYYQKYDRFFLEVSITCGLLGWTMYVMTIVLREFSGVVMAVTKLDMLKMPFFLQEKFLKSGYACLAAVIVLLLLVQSLPWTYYLYCLIPVALWMQVSLNYYVLQQSIEWLWNSGTFTSFLIGIFACCVGLEILVVGFFQRELLSIALGCMAVWPLQYWKKVNDKASVVGWLCCCLMLAVFPMLPVVGRSTNYYLVLIGGIMAVVCSLLMLKRLLLVDTNASIQSYKLNYCQILLLLISVYIVLSTSSSISSKQGLPVINQLISWSILGVSLASPLLAGTAVLQRLLSISLGFLTPYILLSISHETLFVVVLCCVMYFWLRLESTLTSKHTRKIETIDFIMKDVRPLQRDSRNLEMADVRRAFFFIFFILIGFFGTGNIASINSFEPASVYCFLTVFNPFLMGTLMMLKNVIPMVIVTSVFRAVHITTHIPIRALFLIVLIMSEFMALNFFFLVQDHGSWLEIGTSISHYVIVMCMIIFIMLLFWLSQILTTFSLLPHKSHLR